METCNQDAVAEFDPANLCEAEQEHKWRPSDPACRIFVRSCEGRTWIAMAASFGIVSNEQDMKPDFSDFISIGDIVDLWRKKK